MKIHACLVSVCALVIMACSSIFPVTPEVSPTPTRPVAYWSVEELSSKYHVEKIEVAGTYEAIGYALGQWYQSHGSVPRPLTTGEQEFARMLIAFCDSVHPSIRRQLQGVYAAYGLSLDDLSQGIPIWDEEGVRFLLPGLVEPHSCSMVFTRPDIAADGHARLGRNHDWPTMLSDVLLVFTYPDDGYPTVVMNHGPTGFSASDGMNSQGLAFGLASVRNIGYISPTKPALPSNSAYRLVLEHSASVDGAVAMLSSIPVTFINLSSNEVISHILLADRTGDSAVVEYLPEGMVVSRTDTPYQVMTNSHWAGPSDQPQCDRYRTAVAGLKKATGKMDDKGLMKLLASIQGSTQWSIIYDLEDLSLVLALPDDGFSTRHEFSLAEFISRMK